MTKRIGIFSTILFFVLFVIFAGYNVTLNYLAKRNTFDVTTNYTQKQLAPKPPHQVIRILAIQGGGIYGIIPIHALQYLEKKSGKPISELFDVIIGTSTGSIIATFLTMPDHAQHPRYTADEILNLYNLSSQKIFYAPWYHRILTLGGLLGPKYLTISRNQLFNQLLGHLRIEQLLNHVIIPTYGLRVEKPLFFYSWKAKNASYPEDQNFYVKDILLGAISPPHFFAPTVINNTHNVKFFLSDAGLYMDNPSLAGLTIAMDAYPNHPYLLVTLGTGESTPDLAAQKLSSWGLMQWTTRLLPLSIHGDLLLTESELHNYFQSQKLPVPKSDYFYFNIPIPGIKPPMDDTSDETIQFINHLGDQLVSNNQKELDRLIVKLTTH